MKRIVTDFDGVWNPLGWVEGMTPYKDMTQTSFTDSMGDTINVYVSDELMAFARELDDRLDIDLRLLSTWNNYIDPDTFCAFGFPMVAFLPYPGEVDYATKVSAVLESPDDMETLWLEDELSEKDKELLAEGNKHRRYPVRLLPTVTYHGLTPADVFAIRSFIGN